MTTFLPWVGSGYRQGFLGVRLLVLGESHYEEPGTEDINFTRDVVRKLGQQERSRSSGLFTRVATLALGRESSASVSQEERARFWEQVAFYNYVQSFLAEARMRPSESQWADAQLPFLEVVEQLAPQVLLVLGKELSSRLPSVHSSVVVCSIAHPSSVGFAYATWRHHFNAALARANAAT